MDICKGCGCDKSLTNDKTCPLCDYDKANKYRLTIIPALEYGTRSVAFEFNTIKEVDAAHEAVAMTLLFLQDTIKAMPNYSNAFLQRKVC